MRNNQKNQGEKFEIPPEGTLGLLAYGATGLRAWRKVRDEYIKNNPDSQILPKYVKTKEDKDEQ